MTTIEANGAKSAIAAAQTVGGWPMGGDNKPTWQINDIKSWAVTLHQFAVEMVEQPIISIYVGVDESNVVNHLAAVDQPGLFLGTEKYYESVQKTPKNADLKNAYINYAADLAELYCKSNEKTCTRSDIESAAAAVYDMENDIA